ncbi:DNA-binding domain protein [Vibrio phage 1.276.O._10N.286.54.E4]|nr:DNA-binding domain protein [Vibrio phage 1.276.O._10N.286.54.E4]
MRNKIESIKVGSILDSNTGGKFEVLECSSSRSVLIKFVDTGFETRCTVENIKIGKVKDRLKPTVYSVGFIGDGRFKSQYKCKNGDAYKSWLSMMQRCYSEKSRKKNPTYSDCYVCDEWHNFQNFASWYEDNHPKDGGNYEIDKDFRVVGNKKYSPEACILIPKHVNTFTTDCRASRGKYLIGVTFDNQTGKFRSQCQNPITRKRVDLGRFDCEIEAHTAWRDKKYEMAIALADSQGRVEVKKAILNWAQALKEFRVHPIER